MGIAIRVASPKLVMEEVSEALMNVYPKAVKIYVSGQKQQFLVLLREMTWSF